MSREKYEKLANRLALEYRIDPAFFSSIIEQESNWDPVAESPAGAQGLTQLRPIMQDAYGVDDWTDPEQSMRGSLQFFDHLFNKYGDDNEKVIAAYNRGETAFDSGSPMPEETSTYVDRMINERIPRYRERYKPLMTEPTTSPQTASTQDEDLGGGMYWYGDRPNSIAMPDGTVLPFAAGVTMEEADRMMKDAEPSGTWASIFSTWERMKGALKAAPHITYGHYADKPESIAKGRKIHEEYGEAARKELPDPASLESIEEAWDEGGLFPAAGEVWQFGREMLGMSTAYMGPGFVAGKIGHSDLVAKSPLGTAVSKILAKAIPALRVAGTAAPHPLAKVGLGTLAGMGTYLLQFYADGQQRQVEKIASDNEGVVNPEDIRPEITALAAVPQAAMQWIFPALMGGMGKMAQSSAAVSISKSLALGSTTSGRQAMGAVGKSAIESLVEFPTELAQTVLDRAQAGESISLEDAEFVRELWETVAGTVPVVGVFGAGGAYRAHRAEKAEGAAWEKMTESEKKARSSAANRRAEAQREEQGRLARIQGENESRWEAAKEQARRNNDTVKLRAMEESENTPVSPADIIAAADSRNIYTNTAGFRAFIHQHTGRSVSSVKDLNNQDRRKIHSILSGMKIQQYADSETGVDMPMFTDEQLDLVLRKTKVDARINQDEVRRILGLTNFQVDKDIARAIVEELKSLGHVGKKYGSVKKGQTNPFRRVSLGFTEKQYREILNESQEAGRVTQGLVERVTKKYGEKPYRKFIAEMRNRGDLLSQDESPGVYVPVTLKQRLEAEEEGGRVVSAGARDVRTKIAKGYLIRDADNNIVGGFTNKNRATREKNRLKELSRTYSVTRNGQIIHTLSKLTRANEYLSAQQEADPRGSWEIVKNGTRVFSVDNKRSNGVKVEESFRNTETEGGKARAGGRLSGLNEIGFAPSQSLADVLMNESLDDMTPGQSDWEIRKESHRKKSEEEMREALSRVPGVPLGKGMRLDAPQEGEFFPAPDSEELIARRREVLQAVNDSLKAAGLKDDVIGTVVARIEGGEAEFNYSGDAEHIGTILVALENIADAKTPDEVRAAVSDVMNHEMIHAMRMLDLFTENEWRALENSTARVKIGADLLNTNRGGRAKGLTENSTFLEWAEAQYEKKPGYETRDSIVEEAVAEMYRQYHSSPTVREQLVGAPRTLIERIQRFMERMYNSFSGIGFADAGDVIRGMGVVQARDRSEVRTPTMARMANADVALNARINAEREQPDEGRKLSVGNLDAFSEPPVKLTAKQREVWDEALGVMRNAYEDQQFISDNPGASTRPFMLAELRERIDTDARNTFTGDAAQEEFENRKPGSSNRIAAANGRSIDNLLKKLDSSGFFDDASFTPRAEATGRKLSVSGTGLVESQRGTGQVLQGEEVLGGDMYSLLAKTIREAPARKMTVSQLRGLLMKKGVKREEIEWTGLEDRLEALGPEGKLNLDVLQGEIDFIEIEEVVLGGGPLHQFGSREEQEAGRARVDAARAAVGAFEDRGRPDLRNDVGARTEWDAIKAEFDEAQSAMRDIAPGWGRAEDAETLPTRHETYTLPGGENYRETLITLRVETREERISDLDTRLSSDKGLSEAEYEERNRLRAGVPYEAAPAFTDGHYGSVAPNVLVYVRHKNRFGPNGEKILFIEEIQDDWAKAGREKGYQGDYSALRKKILENAREHHYVKLGNVSMEEVAAAISELEREPRTEKNPKAQAAWPLLHELNLGTDIDLGAFYDIKRSETPDRPFKSTSHEMALNRMISKAIREGYDSVAWTPGHVQVARYESELRKTVDAIEWEKWEEGRVKIDAYKDGSATTSMTVDDETGLITGSDEYYTDDSVFKEMFPKGTPLKDVVGKDIARQILEASGPSGTVDGDNLTIGGKGFADIYDGKLVKSANDVGKRFGAKVEMGEVESDALIGQARRAQRFNRGEELEVTQVDEGEWTILNLGVPTATYPDRMTAEAQRQRLIDEVQVIDASTVSAHTLDLTPEMKSTVGEKGLPLFPGRKFSVGGTDSFASSTMDAIGVIDSTTSGFQKDRDRKVVYSFGNFAVDPSGRFDEGQEYPSRWGDVDPNMDNSFGIVVTDRDGNLFFREADTEDGLHSAFSSNVTETGETPLEAAKRGLEDTMGIGVDTPGFKIVGVLPGEYAAGSDGTYFYVAEIDGDNEANRPTWVDPGSDGKVAMELMGKNAGFIPLINEKAPSSQNARPVLRDHPELTEESRELARGNRVGRKLSVGDQAKVALKVIDKESATPIEALILKTSPPTPFKSLWDLLLNYLTHPVDTLGILRNKFVDKYHGIEKVVRKAQELRGDDKGLLASFNALSAAYLSDRANAVLGEAVTSGQPVLRGGIVQIDYTKKGLLEILKDLFIDGTDHTHFWHTWMIANRGKRFDADGKVVPMTTEEMKLVQTEVDAKGLREIFEKVNEGYQEWNESLVDLMRKTGVVDERLAEIFKSFGDYVPFYREWEGEAEGRLVKAMEGLIGKEAAAAALEGGGGPQSLNSEGRIKAPSSMFGSMTGVQKPKAAKGGQGMTVDPLTGIIKNAQAAIGASMKNTAAVKVMRDALYIGMADKVFSNFEQFKANKLKDWEDRLISEEKISDETPGIFPTDTELRAQFERIGDGTHTVRENGVEVTYKVYDQLLHDSLSGMLDGKIKYLSFFAGPSTFLREMVTRSPDFILANLLRDGVSSWVTSGADIKPFVSTFHNFFKGGISGGEGVGSYQTLLGAGVIGGYDFGRDVKDFRKEFGRRLKDAGMPAGKGMSRYGWSIGKKIWDKAGDVSTKSDAATRMAVYEDVLSKTLAMEGVSRADAEAEAIFQALEVMNFGRRGNSSLAKIITAVTPFLNARIQGLDVLYRAGSGRYSSDVSKLAKNRAMLSFISRGSLITFATLAYSLTAHDEEEWKRAGPVAQDDNWILGGLKIPIPFEVGVIFKLWPERFLRWYNGQADNRQTVESIKRSFVSTFEFNPFGPQITKPIMEGLMNHSFFTGQPIVPTYLSENRLAENQYRPSTDQLSVEIGKAFGVSPLKVSSMLKGYTGTLGSYVLFATDYALREVKGIAPRPSLRVDQMVGLKRFYTSDQSTRTVMTDFYDLQAVSKATMGSLRDLLDTGNLEKVTDFVEEHSGVIKTDSAVKLISKQLKQLRDFRKKVVLAPESVMSVEKKNELIRQINDQTNALMEYISPVRDAAELTMNPWVP